MSVPWSFSFLGFPFVVSLRQDRPSMVRQAHHERPQLATNGLGSPRTASAHRRENERAMVSGQGNRASISGRAGNPSCGECGAIQLCSRRVGLRWVVMDSRLRGNDGVGSGITGRAITSSFPGMMVALGLVLEPQKPLLPPQGLLILPLT